MTPRPVRVLCVEDDLLQQRILEHHLRAIPDLACAATFEVSEAGAIDAFRRENPDVVLVDYQLAEGDGLSLIRRIRAIDTLVPVVAISGVAPAEVAEELIRSGADDYIDKRVLDSAGLARCLGDALRRVEAFRARLPVPGPGEAVLTDLVRELYTCLARLGSDTLVAHADAVVVAARGTGLRHVSVVFERVCFERGASSDLARRVLQPYLLEVIAQLNTAPDTAS
jgi:CheY-like chemotaxis protein